MRKGKKSFFSELLTSFLLLLCIPIITIMLILWQSNRIVREQVLDIEDMKLQLYEEQLEEVMEGMKDVCHSLFSNNYCKIYASEINNDTSWARDVRNKVIDTLKGMRKIDYYDVFVYYDDSNRIISGRYSPQSAESYYETYYSEVKVDERLRIEFMEILTADYRKPMCHIINAGTDDAYLCMTMRVKNINSNYTVCVVLEPSYLNQLLVMQRENEDSVFRMFNVNKELMFSNNLAPEKQDLGKPSSWDEEMQDRWLEHEDYMVQVRVSKHLDNYYVYAVSKDMFWGTFYWLRVWGFVGAGLCVLVSVLIAYRRTRRVYRPVENLMGVLSYREENGTQKKEKSEFDYILSFIERQEKVLKENKKISKEWFLHGILEGKAKNISAEQLEENSISFAGEKFSVAVIYAEVLNPKLESLCGFIVQNVLEELCDSIGKGYLVELSSNRYALLASISAEGTDLSGILKYGQEFLREKMQIVLSIGYSGVAEGISAITDAYREAQEAIRYRFLMGNGKMIAYEEIKARSAGYRNNEQSKVYMLLLEYMENRKNDEEPDAIVEQLMYIYQINEEMSIDVAQVFKKEIVSALCEIMDRCCFDEESIDKVKQSFKNADTLLDFRELLTVQINELYKYRIKRNASVDILEETKRFIEENYSDGELSIASIGTAMGLHSNYLSQIFKGRYGMTLIDYVATVRVQQAKKLIEEGGMSVQKVGEKCGFLSSSVFIRTFKKKEGITPGKYKEMIELGGKSE